MRVDIIEHIDDFERIRKNWDKVYQNDPNSHPCLSWERLREYLPSGRRWFLLALRREQSDAHYCAFLPLEVTTYLDESSGLFCDEMLMAGNHGTGRTGLLCTPNLENEAIEASASYIGRENWARMTFEFLDPGSAQLERLFHAFPADRFIRERTEDFKGGVDSPRDGIRRAVVRTRSGRNLRNCLNRRSIDIVFERAMELHAHGELDRAEAAYRQVVQAAPQHTHARYGLAQLCCDRGDYTEAERIYRGMLSTMPHADRILHRLGDTQMVQALYREASETFEDLLGRHPHLGLIRYKLAVCLLAAGQKEAAIAIFLSFGDIASDDPDHMRCKLKSQEAVSRLRMLSAGEPEADRRTPQVRISLARASYPSGDWPAPLLKPSLPRGVSAHLHARPTPYDRSGSRLKH